MENHSMIANCNGVEIYDNDMELAIADACEKYGIGDLVGEGQTRWKAVMHYVGKNVFPDNKILRDKSYIHINGNNIPTNCNRYDYNVLNILCDYYIDISRRYNKLISIVAFAEFINVPIGTIEQWGMDEKNRGPGATGSAIHKKIKRLREDGLQDKAIDSGNVMGVFQVGRREYHWDMPGVQENRTKKPLAASELPKLSHNSPPEITQNSV